VGADTTQVGFRVFTRVERPDSAVLSLFADLETTNLSDTVYGMGVAVLPGDVIVADADGVVVPRADAAAVATRAQVVQREKGSAADFSARWAAAREGQAPPSVDKLLRDQGCVIVD
jgi:regulator of RNase E activity RraA